MWVVDTCVLVDVLEDDPSFGRRSALALRDRLVCPALPKRRGRHCSSALQERKLPLS